MHCCASNRIKYWWIHILCCKPCFSILLGQSSLQSLAHESTIQISSILIKRDISWWFKIKVDTGDSCGDQDHGPRQLATVRYHQLVPSPGNGDDDGCLAPGKSHCPPPQPALHCVTLLTLHPYTLYNRSPHPHNVKKNCSTLHTVSPTLHTLHRKMCKHCQVKYNERQQWSEKQWKIVRQT